tara:strand:+ start:434 stop:661 length:228 start_codon:yes stop_codon:yes gene_type:complete
MELKLMIDITKLNRGRRVSKSVRLTENQIECLNLLIEAAWVEDNRELTFSGALRSILNSYDWSFIDELDLKARVR